jgi:predicted DNA-binding transcriptional regulator AlpA
MQDQQLIDVCNAVLSRDNITFHELAKRAINGSEPTEPKETLIDRAAACHRLGGISSTSLWRLVKNKQLHVRKVGRRAMFRAAEIDAFIKGDAA